MPSNVRSYRLIQCGHDDNKGNRINREKKKKKHWWSSICKSITKVLSQCKTCQIQPNVHL